MELRQIRYFLAVATHRNFTRAAETLHVSQPSLSVQVSMLEEEVGTPLFDRLGRSVELTQAGEIFREHAERIFHELERAFQMIGDMTDGNRGCLRVGAIATVNCYLIPPLVSRFRKRFSGVQLQIENMPSAQIVSAVLSNQLDVGLCLFPVKSERLVAVRLFEERLVLVAPSKDRTRARRLRVKELAHLPLVLMPVDYCLREMVETECAAAGVQPNVSVEMTSPDGILEAVRHGAGHTVLPELYVKSRLRGSSLRAVPLYDPVPRHAVGLISVAGRHPSVAAKEFMRLCQVAAAELQVGTTGDRIHTTHDGAEATRTRLAAHANTKSDS